MSDDDLISIGRFAALTGLSVHAIRHYDDVGLLAPASVDSDTGYRRYRIDQIPKARLIMSLRWVDLPINDIRELITPDADPAAVREILSDHRTRLDRHHSLTRARLRDVDRFIEKGLTMPDVTTAARPVQIKLAVDDIEKSAAFYSNVFAARYDVIRRTEDVDYSSLVFGEYGRPDFFLIVLMSDDDVDRPAAPSTLGFLVDDLDGVHEKAIAAGGAELVAPHSPEGMPRCSAVGDPSGNWVWLYQG